MTTHMRKYIIIHPFLKVEVLVLFLYNNVSRVVSEDPTNYIYYIMAVLSAAINIILFSIYNFGFLLIVYIYLYYFN